MVRRIVDTALACRLSLLHPLTNHETRVGFDQPKRRSDQIIVAIELAVGDVVEQSASQLQLTCRAERTGINRTEASVADQSPYCGLRVAKSFPLWTRILWRLRASIKTLGAACVLQHGGHSYAKRCPPVRHRLTAQIRLLIDFSSLTHPLGVRPVQGRRRSICCRPSPENSRHKHHVRRVVPDSLRSFRQVQCP